MDLPARASSGGTGCVCPPSGSGEGSWDHGWLPLRPPTPPQAVSLTSGRGKGPGERGKP
jgi:hypothetical protein